MITTSPMGSHFCSAAHLLASASFLIAVVISSIGHLEAFHLSFGHRLFKSVLSNPQLNPPSTLIRPIECRNTNNQSETGICMFSIDCIQNKGVPLSICKHNYFVGTCCRLPDYNNFVDIVYDLRATETGNHHKHNGNQLEAANQLLEARKTALSSLDSTEPPSSNGGALSGESSLTVTVQNSAVSLANLTSAPKSVVQLQQQLPSSSLAPPQASSSMSTLSTAATSIATSPDQHQRPTEDKYMISSTSLFPISSSTSVVTSSSPSLPPTTTSASASTSTSQRPTDKESARNAEGSIVNSLMAFAKPNQAVSSSQNELVDTFQIQSAPQNNITASLSNELQQYQHPMNGSQHKQSNSSAYELIRDDSNNASLEVLSTMSSAHSAPSGFPSNQHQQTVVFANNHQPQVQGEQEFSLSSSMINHQNNYEPVVEPVASRPPPPSPLALSNSTSTTLQLVPSINTGPPESSTSTLANSDTSSATPTTTTTTSATSATNAATSTSTTTTTTTTTVNTSSPAYGVVLASSQQPPLTGSPSQSDLQLAIRDQTDVATNNSNDKPLSSPFVDLVSPPQTTTPFTMSLSTALLPNVSSHPYAPTQQHQLVSAATPKGQHQWSPPTTAEPVVMGSSGASSSPLYTHFYSSHQPSVSTAANSQSGSAATPSSVTAATQRPISSSAHSSSLPHIIHLSLPSLILGAGPQQQQQPLQAASKIVAASSTTNQLIPGLSGLQSAILSHIPFKISGLSSGLSSYLQAAMKPTGTRPLLSSNTAPALQYQYHYQHQHQHQTNNSTGSTHRPSSPSSSSSSSSSSWSSSSSSSSTASPQVRFPSGASSSASSTLAPANDTSTAASGADQSVSGHRDSLPRDFVREAQQICGRPQVSGIEAKKRVARIVGGNQSLFGQWPWMVSLRQWRKGAFLHKCGAALLNENWAITAAHCVENVKAPDLLLRLGEFDVSNRDEPYPYIERSVKTVVSHPSFDPKTFEYDLALLRFTEPIQFERNIIPVCVPDGNDTYVDRMATVIGWGRLYEDGPLPDVIQHVDVPIITNNECEKMYKNAGYIEEIPEMFICAGINKGGRDSCEGDSGGPLTMVDHDGRSYLVGIISWGIGCALPSQPGVYTRITAFSGWINQIIAN